MIHNKDMKRLFRKFSVGEAEIYYHAHSTVMISCLDGLFVFDWFQDSPSEVFDGCESDLMSLGSSKKIHFLNSHQHGDHYNPVIFDVPEIWNANYILSYDICEQRDIRAKLSSDNNFSIHCSQPDKWISLEKSGQNREKKILDIFSIPSSDEGVAFYLKLPESELSLYFSGDNAFWDWEANRKSEIYFQGWLKPLMNVTKKVNIAFQTADPRCSDTHFGGISDLSDYISSDILIPIHNFGDFSKSDEMEKRVKSRHPEQSYWNIKKNGEFFCYNRT